MLSSNSIYNETEKSFLLVFKSFSSGSSNLIRLTVNSWSARWGVSVPHLSPVPLTLCGRRRHLGFLLAGFELLPSLHHLAGVVLAGGTVPGRRAEQSSRLGEWKPVCVCVRLPAMRRFGREQVRNDLESSAKIQISAIYYSLLWRWRLWWHFLNRKSLMEVKNSTRWKPEVAKHWTRSITCCVVLEELSVHFVSKWQV